MADDQRTQQATLGCGTLILIGIVVLFVTKGGFGEIDDTIAKLRGSVDELRLDVERLERKIDTLTQRLPAPDGKGK